MTTAFAPGRVNLIGDHTDYTGGFVLPMAVHLGTTVILQPGGERVRLTSASESEPCDLPLEVGDPSAVRPAWGRYVAGVISETHPREGGQGIISSTLPSGAGLSSSAALEVAVALALGFTGSPLQLALACQRAEQNASKVPCGVMDQLASAAGVAGHALLIDCTTNDIRPVAIPGGVEVVAVHSGQKRRLAGSAYAERRAECEAAAAIVGPLRRASVDDLGRIDDGLTRRRARHVITENQRVLAFADALETGRLKEAGELMAASHESLRTDFGVSTPVLDDLVAALSGVSGVYGARLTGAGFGGCVVALTAPGVLDSGCRLQAVGGACRLET